MENVTPFVLKCRAVRRHLLALGAMLAGAGLLGCDRGPCNSTRSAILGPDGGLLSCIRAEDCPLTGTLLVCVDTGEPNHVTEACVRCVQTACVKDVCVP